MVVLAPEYRSNPKLQRYLGRISSLAIGYPRRVVIVLRFAHVVHINKPVVVVLFLRFGSKSFDFNRQLHMCCDVTFGDRLESKAWSVC